MRPIDSDVLLKKFSEEYERLNAECMRLKGLLHIENDSEEECT